MARVIEGVMMRGRHSLAIAVRRNDGVVLHEENLTPWAQRYPIWVGLSEGQ